MFKYLLGDGKGSKNKAHLHRKNGDVGLITYTRPLIEYEPLNIPALNDTYGNQIAQDFSQSGTPDQIHDGEDSVLWTASAISGTWTFNSAAQAHSGVQSVDATSTVNASIAQFAKGSDLTLANYVALTGWIYITAWSAIGTKEVKIYGWDTGTAMQNGDQLNLADYVDNFTFNSWQKFAIPLSDFNFSGATVDAVRVQTIDIGGGPPPDYYLDDLQFEELGDPAAFDITPPTGKRFLVHKFRYTLVDAYAGTLADATMPNLSYNKLLGVTSLPVGLIFTRFKGNTPAGRAVIHNVGDAVIAGAEIINIMSDGINTSITILREFSEPIILDSAQKDIIRISAADDISGLISLTAVATGVIYEE